MTETGKIRKVVIAPNRPIKEDLTIEENKAKHRMARMKFIERCCSGEYIPRPLKEDNTLTDEEKRKIKAAKAKAINQRFRQKNREAFNAYMNAKMKEKYKNNEEHRNREKEKAKMRYRRRKEQKLAEIAALIAISDETDISFVEKSPKEV
jgi:hypothetical protein